MDEVPKIVLRIGRTAGLAPLCEGTALLPDYVICVVINMLQQKEIFTSIHIEEIARI